MALWESAALAMLGAGLTTVGAWLAVRWQAREARRTRTEQIGREDRLRFHNERIECYSLFFQEAGDTRIALKSLRQELTDASIPQPATVGARRQRNRLWRVYTRLVLIGDDEVVRAASSLLGYVTRVAWRKEDFEDAHFEQLVQEFVGHARSDVRPP